MQTLRTKLTWRIGLLASLLVVLSPFTQAGTESCPLTPAEINSALGLDVDAGQAQNPLIFAGGQMLICDYQGKTKPSLLLKQTVMADVNNPYNTNYLKMMAGELTPVPGDPDGALWQLDQGDLSNPTLHYLRKGALVELRVMVGRHDDLFKQYVDALPKLRRFP